MNILMVIPCFSTGGIEKMAWQWCDAFIRMGHSCDVLAFDDEKDERFKKIGCQTYVVPITSKKVFSSKKRLVEFFERHQCYDVVHSHVSFCGGLIGAAYRKARGSGKVIMHAHLNADRKCSSWISEVYNHFFRYYCIKLIKKYSDLNLACSTASGEHLFGRGNYKVIANGINIRQFAFSAEKRIEYRYSLGIQNRFVLIYPARFDENKNHTFLIDIFAELKKIRHESVLVLLGNGPLEHEIKQKCQTLGVIDQVLFLGYRNDVYNLCSMSDVLVFPSLLEGFPVSVVEAQINGLYCVVSDAIPKEAALNDRIQFLSTNRSAKYWAKCIAALPLNANGRLDCVDYAKRRKFDCETSADDLIGFYNK